jgi:glycosyltransferase involved in cell wall biosynthesis
VRNVVLYVGGFGLPDRSASALRALGNAAVLRNCGYEVVLAGKFEAVPDSDLQPLRVHGFACYDIRRPLPGVPLVDYTRSAANIRALAEHLGTDRIAAVMAYNYPGFGLHRLLRVGHRFSLPVINESTEWYGWEGFRPVSNARRILESRWRNSSLVERAGNLVCATHWLVNRHPAVNSMVLPFALDPEWECWQVAPDASWSAHHHATRLVYSGSPGLGMHKDRLPLILAALDQVANSHRPFAFGIVGMTKAQYLQAMPQHSDLLKRHAENIRFLGRLPHEGAVAVLKSADFSVFVRENNRVSDVGFPTKHAEASVCGVPVLTNRTSDIADYLVDGSNGILLPDCSPATIAGGLGRALGMTRDQHDRMRGTVNSRNPFAVDAWTKQMREFMRKLTLPK